MRRWIVRVAKLYPREWRERYGVEFDALMEDVTPDWREFLDILGGAVKLQIQSGTGALKLVGAVTVLAMVVAVGVSLVTPGRFVSTAMVRVTPPPGGLSKEVAAAQVTQKLERLQQEALSRGSLVELIQRPSLNLYRGERQRIPVEDVIQNMRRDIVIKRVEGAQGMFSISFAYPDRIKAQTVTRELAAKFVDGSSTVNLFLARLWKDAWHEDAPEREQIQLVQAANEPDAEPRLPKFLAWGAGSGLLLGSLTYAFVRRRRLVLRLAAFGLAGCALTGAASYLIPARYASSVVMRITPPLDPKRWYAGREPVTPADRVRELEKAVLTRERLGSLVNLMRKHFHEGPLAGAALDDAVSNFRDRELRIEMMKPPLAAGDLPSAFAIAVTADNPRKAQAIVRELVSAFFWEYVSEARARSAEAGEEYRMMEEHKLGENLEVLDPASLPQAPIFPNRELIAMLGMVSGILLGALTKWRRKPRGSAIDGATAPAIS